MTTLTPYLLFDGTCREAMEFYRSCLGGELVITAVKDSPAKDKMPASEYDKALNARLRSSNLDISASDCCGPIGHQFGAIRLVSISRKGRSRS